MTTPIAIGVDLGSTRIKAAILRSDGRLSDFIHVPAPSLKGEEPVRECDAEEYLVLARELLQKTLGGSAKNLPIGIAVQRSSFLLWEKRSGQPVTPMISWQDRRAQPWCEKHRESYRCLASKTGLPLSPHYAGPKLATLFSENFRLKTGAVAGEILFGTLETYLIWRITRGQKHQTDLSMAARTLMVNIDTGAWDPQLLSFFDIPSNILPEIVSTSGRNDPLTWGGHLAVSVADQASGILAAHNEPGSSIIVNLGTGGFVSAYMGRKKILHPGYLTSPLARMGDGTILYALEGTLNAIGPALFRYPAESPVLDVKDPWPDLFCLPDSAGVGSPFWLPDMGLQFSVPESEITAEAARRAVMEGIVFRICRIIEDFRVIKNFDHVWVSGGLISELFSAQSLSVCCGLPVAAVKEKESTLRGACLLAAQTPVSPPEVIPVKVFPGCGRYLKEKYFRWRDWVERLLAGLPKSTP